MKILHILNHSVPHTDGYAVRSASIVRFQSGLGLEPVVVTSPRHEPVPTADVEVIDGVRYYRTFSRPGRGVPFLREIRSVRRMAARIEEIVQIERPDILHAHSPCLWGKAAARVARRHGLPLVYEIRGLWEDAAVDQGKIGTASLKYRFGRALETRVARSADAVTTIAEHLKGEFIQRGISREKIVLVPNGVDVDSFNPRHPDEQLVSELGLDGCIRIGYVGSLSPWEGIEDLLRAVPEIVSQAPRARFLIIGGGEQEATIRTLIRDLDVAGHVQFVGRVPHEDIARYYSIMDILVYPRKPTRNTELVTPLKPLEAMVMEKAVLGSDVGGVSELLEAGTGLLCRAGDPADLAKKCLQLITHPEQRRLLGVKAREHVLATRDWKTLIRRYLDVYAIAANGR